MFSAGHPEVWSHLRISTCPPRIAESWISIHFAPLTGFKKKKPFKKLEGKPKSLKNAAVCFLRKQVTAVHS